MKTICVDYDGTLSDFYEYLEPMMEKMLKDGINVIVCTMRYEEEQTPVLEKIAKFYPVHYSGRKAKEQYLLEKGIVVDLWIDDKPFWIYQNSR